MAINNENPGKELIAHQNGFYPVSLPSVQQTSYHVYRAWDNEFTRNKWVCQMIYNGVKSSWQMVVKCIMYYPCFKFLVDWEKIKYSKIKK